MTMINKWFIALSDGLEINVVIMRSLPRKSRYRGATLPGS